MKAVILYSGGLDSMTLLGVANSMGFTELLTIGFDYGQPHDHCRLPTDAVKKRHGIIESVLCPTPLLGPACSLVSEDVDVPKRQDPRAPGVPNTWVPARNLVFLSHAANYAAAKDATDIFIGVNQLDFSGYPDCRSGFISAVELAMRTGVSVDFKIHTPLIQMKKTEIIELGLSLGVDYSETQSCYDPMTSGESCGECDSCQLRLEAFVMLGYEDPIHYVTS